ncbi:MAG: universal stress protein [Winogradskyella sp.]|uniref:universal stress protein n=1 Tax=Winogradskyella sp. TaxID=1883156 RepID=UPI000F3E36E8|nr:universal stress protein [Winogradskyella sp.]RNC87749.1 MAG: universal stress protein [Winogradskyella sp.]
MKKILLPTDFSDNAWNAITYALELFKNKTCCFTLLNTYTPMIYQVEHLQSSSVPLQVLDAVKQTSKKKLENLQQKITTEFNNPKHTFVQLSSFNTLVAEIDELYRNNAIDIIVMGTKGATGLKEVLFGSNTVHVIKKAKCPVLAIPSNFTFEAPHEILFPSDYHIEFQDKHLESILDIADDYGARVHFLNVVYDNSRSEFQEENKRKLVTYFKSITHLFHDVKNKKVQEAINDFQIKLKINLLVMLHNKHSFVEDIFFKSNIKQIGFHLNVPFLVIPSEF